MIASIVLSLVSALLTGAVGVMVGRLNGRIAKSDAAREKKEAARVQNEALLIKMSMASLSLGEATAEAIQRNPAMQCNGEMHEALDYAKRTKQEYRDFERKQTAESLN